MKLKATWISSYSWKVKKKRDTAAWPTKTKETFLLFRTVTRCTKEREMQEKIWPEEKDWQTSLQLFLLTGSLSSVFGEARMRGFLKFRIICLRSRWKYWAGVVGWATHMFTVSPSTPSSVLSHIWEGSERKEPTVESAHSILRAQAMPRGTGYLHEMERCVSSSQKTRR